MDYNKYVNNKQYSCFGSKTDKGVKLYEEWIAEEIKIVNQFKEDFFAELGIESNPKRFMFFDKCWLAVFREDYTVDKSSPNRYKQIMFVGTMLVDLIL